MTGPSPVGSEIRPSNGVSLPSPRATLDNAISWTDQLFFHQWKIQQHVETNACRLLDEKGDCTRDRHVRGLPRQTRVDPAGTESRTDAR